MPLINNTIIAMHIIFLLLVLSLFNLISKDYHYVLEDTKDCFKLLKELVR
ncbi:hypothetical protein GF336_04125 [Candidatus Woesearchaeota archaeon]|nr:hypothetical protein [Candidatus Woesearchaeota archaeon]